MAFDELFMIFKHLLCCVLVALTFSVRAQYLFNDEFSGSTVDTNNWSTLLPFQSSQVVQSNGQAVFLGRGTLGSTASFTDPISLETRFRFITSGDHFAIVLRSDLFPVGAYAERRGILVAFSQDGGQVSIQEADTNSIIVVTNKNQSLPLNTDFTVRLTDDGTTIKLFLNDYSRPLLATSSTFQPGAHVALYNREFSSSRAEVDYVRVAALVELSILPAIELNFFAKTNHLYQIQGSTDMSLWANLGSPIPGSNSVYGILYSTQATSNRFYRVQLVP